MLASDFAIVLVGGIAIGAAGMYGLLVFISTMEENKKLKHEQIKGVELWQRLSQTEEKESGQKPTK